MTKLYRNNYKKRSAIVGTHVLCLVAAHFTFAQNVNFSQYQNAPYYTNPALIGSKSEAALSVLHRSQALTDLEKYNTSTVMADVPLIDFKTGRRWGGFGFSVINDELKGGVAYRMQGLSALYAYNLPLSKRYYASFGMQAGYYQRKLSSEGLTTSSQWIDNMGFDPNASLGEAFSGMRKNYISLGTGLLFYAEDDNSRQVARFGVVAFNVNQPNASFTAERDIIPVKVTAQGSIALLNDKTNLLFGEMLFYRENSRNTYHVGARATHYFSNHDPFDALKEGSIDFKAGYRVNNAITTEIQFHQPNFTIGIAYDFGVASNESRSNNNGAFEILLVLKKLIVAQKNKQITRTGSYSTIGEVRNFYFEKKKEEPVSNNRSETQTQQDVSVRSDENFEFKLQRDFKFGFNEATLNNDSKAYLDDLVNLLNSNKNFILEVIGHTDNVGTNEANREVSMKRAGVVIDYLIAQGIDAKRLRATPLGAKQPVAPNDSEENRSKNRRVEFVIRDLSQ